MLRYFRYAKEYTISRFATQKPVLLTHFLTSKCNCKCKMCDIWTKKPAHELTTQQVFKMLDEAKKLHFSAYVMWGGEPLLRQDTLKIMAYAQKLGLYTSLITNGTLLPKKAKEVAEVVDLIWVSIDHPSMVHDELRGLNGVFDSAIKGIKELKKQGGTVAVNCVLSKLNNQGDVIKNMLALSEKLQVRVAFDPMEVFLGFNEKYALSCQEVSGLFSEVLTYKKAGQPILNSYEFIKHQINPTKYSCAQPQILLNIRENGEIFPFWCRKTSSVLGDLRKQSLGEILESHAYREFVQRTSGCCLCNNSVNVETSLFYKPSTFVWNFFRLPSPVVEFISFYGKVTLPNTRYRKKRQIKA
jgi:MoaA/NifB/PqqE/SkfB family radical SAM enzyme